LLDVVTNTLELSMPPKIQLDQVYGFGLWMLKAVLSGQRSNRGCQTPTFSDERDRCRGDSVLYQCLLFRPEIAQSDS
jgi:hypothetical protein